MAPFRRVVILTAAAAFAGGFFLVSPGCDSGSGFASRDLDLIVVSVDTLRADRMSLYGAERDTDLADVPWSPAWLATQGTTYDWCWAPAGKTIPSLGSFWTSFEPLEHGALQNGVPLAVGTYAEKLHREGFTGLCRAANIQLSPRFFNPRTRRNDKPGYGFEKGFDDYDIRAKEREPLVAKELVQIAEQPIHSEEPLLIWAHFMAPHQPYEPAEEQDLWSATNGPPADNETLEAVHANPDQLTPDLKRHLRGLYDAEVRTASGYVQELLSGLDAHYREAGRGGLLENAIVVFFSDHGEELADHDSYFMHAKSLYTGAVRVPLILAGPGCEAGVRVEKPIALREVLPMVVDGRAPQQEVFVASWMSDFFTVRDQRWTLVHNPCGRYPDGPYEPPFRGSGKQQEVYPFRYPEVALYDREADPTEQVDVSNQNPEVVRRLLGELRAWYGALAISDAVPDAGMGLSASQLQELGYASLGAVEICEPWPPERWQPTGE